MEFLINKYCHLFSDNDFGIIYNCNNSKTIVLSKEIYNKLVNEQYSKIPDDILNRLMDYNIVTLKGSVSKVTIPKFQTNKLNIRLFVTSRCNAKCSYCYEAGIKQIEFTDDNQKLLVNFIEKEGNGKDINIEWFGGEPLYKFDVIKKITNLLNEKKINFTSSIITNGSLLNRDIMDFLVIESNLKSIQISLDAIGEKYNNIKKFNYDAFSNVISMIEYICSNYNIKVLIRCNYNENSLLDIKNLIKFFSKKNYKNKLYFGFFPIFNDKTNTDQLKLKEKFYKKILFMQYENGLLKLGDILPRRFYYPCIAKSRKYYAILPNGDIFACDRSYENKLGNLSSPVLKDNVVDCSYKEKCLRCSFFPICFGGCDYERKLGKSGCEFTKKIIDAHLELCLYIYKKKLNRFSVNNDINR